MCAEMQSREGEEDAGCGGVGGGLQGERSKGLAEKGTLE